MESNIYNSVIDPSTKIAKFVEIGNSTIGKRCKIQAFSFIHDAIIEDDAFIGPHVCFTNDKYPRSFKPMQEISNKIVICKGASIGANSTILPGVRIGQFAMVGAGSVVTKDVPPFYMKSTIVDSVCIVIFNPRNLPESLQSIKEHCKGYVQCWIKGHTEEEAVSAFNGIVCSTRYENYIILVDDIVIDENTIPRLLIKDQGLVAGYCYLAQKDKRLNISTKRMIFPDDDYPRWENYNFASESEIPKEAWFAGGPLAMKRSIALSFPLKVNRVTRSTWDAELSKDLNAIDLQWIISPKCYVKHLKKNIETSIPPDRTILKEILWL